MQCCAHTFRARSFFLKGAATIEHVYAFTGALFKRMNAVEASGHPSPLAEGLGSAPQTPVTANSETRQSGGTDASAMPPPPPQWHKRGAWIDPSHIEKRMLVDDSELQPSATNNKEPETEVTKAVAALIRVRLRASMRQ